MLSSGEEESANLDLYKAMPCCRYMKYPASRNSAPMAHQIAYLQQLSMRNGPGWYDIGILICGS